MTPHLPADARPLTADETHAVMDGISTRRPP